MIVVVFPVTVVLGLPSPRRPPPARRSRTRRDQLRRPARREHQRGDRRQPGPPVRADAALGSPVVVALLALTNALVGIALALIAAPRATVTALSGAIVVLAIVVVSLVPGALAQPNERWIQQKNGRLFASAEDEIASVQAGQVRSTPQLWVAGTSMTLLTIDAKLMPILPLMANPDAKEALIVAFGMGSSYRSALIAGLDVEAVELVPSVVDMFGYYYPDAAAFEAHPNGRIVVADGRNHLELSGTSYDIIVTDPPPPIESSGASVISSREYYEAGRDHLKPDGIMMQWTPHGRIGASSNATCGPSRRSSRTSWSPRAGGYGYFFLGSMTPIELTVAGIRDVLERPGVLEDISSAYDSPEKTLEGWAALIPELVTVSEAGVAVRAGDGPLVTDDRPLPSTSCSGGCSTGADDRLSAPSELIAAAISLRCYPRPK